MVHMESCNNRIHIHLTSIILTILRIIMSLTHNHSQMLCKNLETHHPKIIQIQIFHHLTTLISFPNNNHNSFQTRFTLTIIQTFSMDPT